MTQSSKLMTNKNIFSDKWRHLFDFASFDLFSTAHTHKLLAIALWCTIFWADVKFTSVLYVWVEAVHNSSKLNSASHVIHNVNCGTLFAE